MKSARAEAASMPSTGVAAPYFLVGRLSIRDGPHCFAVVVSVLFGCVAREF